MDGASATPTDGGFPQAPLRERDPLRRRPHGDAACGVELDRLMNGAKATRPPPPDPDLPPAA